MARIKIPLDLGNVRTWEELRKYGSICLVEIQQTINGNISFTDNCRTSNVSVTFVGAETKTVAHGLSKIPTGYIVIGRSANIQVFDGAGSSTDTTISLQSSGAGTASILIF